MDFEVIGSIVVSGDGTVKIQGLNRELDTMSTKTSGLGNIMKSFGQSAIFAFGNLLSTGIMAAGRAISDFATSSISAFRESQDVAAELNAVIASTGGIAGVTADMANELATSLSKVTRFEDDTILKGESMLLTFTNIGKDVMPMATEAMLDLAQKMGGDLNGTAIQLGKALNDPIAGVTALRRVGVALTETQEAQIKKFMEVGDIASAQKIILNELGTEFGGLARAMGQTSSGQMEIMKNRIGNIKEGIGELLQGGIGALYGQLSNSGAIDKFEGYVSNLVYAFREAGIGSAEFKEALLAMFPSEVADKFYAIFNGISSWFSESGPGLEAAGKKIFDSLRDGIQAISEKAGPFIESVLQKLGAWFTENGPLIQAFAMVLADVWTNNIMPAIVSAWGVIQPILEGLMTLILGVGKIIMQVVTGDFAGAMETLKTMFTSVGENIREALLGLLNTIATLFGSSLGEVTTAISDWATTSWGVVTAWAQNTWQSITNWFTNVIAGFTSWKNNTVSTVTGFGKSIVDGVKNIFNTLKEGFQTGLLIIFGLWILAWNALLAPFGTSMQEIFALARETFENLKNAISDALTAVVAIVTNVLSSLKTAFSNAWNAVKTATTSAWNSIVSAVKGPLNSMVSAASEMINKIKSSISTGLSNVKSVFSTTFDGIKSYLLTLVNSFFGIGKSIIEGIVNGMKNSAGKVMDFLKGLMKDAIKAAQQALGIQSPSKVFAYIGRMIPEGLQKGIDSAFQLPLASMQTGLNNLQAPAVGMAGGAGVAGANNSQNYSSSAHHHYYGTVIVGNGAGAGAGTTEEFMKATRT